MHCGFCCILTIEREQMEIMHVILISTFNNKIILMTITKIFAFKNVSQKSVPLCCLEGYSTVYLEINCNRQTDRPDTEQSLCRNMRT